MVIQGIDQVDEATRHAVVILHLQGEEDLGSTFIYTKVDGCGLADTALPWPEQEVH